MYDYNHGRQSGISIEVDPWRNGVQSFEVTLNLVFLKTFKLYITRFNKRVSHVVIISESFPIVLSLFIEDTWLLGMFFSTYFPYNTILNNTSFDL